MQFRKFGGIFVVRMLAGPDTPVNKVRGSVEHVESGRTVYFESMEGLCGVLEDEVRVICEVSQPCAESH
jgi:hypothetical protein